MCVINLTIAEWGLFWPRKSLTCNIFFIGWTYFSIFFVILTNHKAFHNLKGFCHRCYGSWDISQNVLGVIFDPKIINSKYFSGFDYIIDPTKWAHWSHQDVKNDGSFIKIGQFFAKQSQFRCRPVCETCDLINDILTRSSIFLKFVYKRCFTTRMKSFVSWLVYTYTIQLVHSQKSKPI